jgi:RNA polymerase sigma-70 factor (ECF subfamily)
MDSRESDQITQILQEVKAGRAEAQDKLFQHVYKQLKRLAANRLRAERPNHTLQPTALVHEAYFRLFAGASPDWQDRTHFFATAAHAMRRVLVDHARKAKAFKRGSPQAAIELRSQTLTVEARAEDIIAVHNALDRLSKHSQRLCQIVEMRFYAGFTEEEIAEILGVSARTVKRDWKTAQAWLHGEIRGARTE